MNPRFYQFHYAEKSGSETVNLGILTCRAEKAIHKDYLIEFTRTQLKRPEANVIITHITKLSQSEYYDLMGLKMTRRASNLRAFLSKIKLRRLRQRS